MTIQEMFNLLRDYKDDTDRVNLMCMSYVDEEEKICAMISQQRKANKVAVYLPFFTPMECKDCIHTYCNRKRSRGVCEEYEVE
jgi:hypothetical protein